MLSCLQVIAVKIICRHYHKHQRKTIECDGVVEGMAVTVCFSSLEDRQKHQKLYCSSAACASCPYAEAAELLTYDPFPDPADAPLKPSPEEISVEPQPRRKPQIYDGFPETPVFWPSPRF